MRPQRLFALTLLSCTSGLAPDYSAPVYPVTSSRDCPAGWVAQGAACDAVLPSGPCDAGTMPVIGSTTCAPVGNTTCGAGFMPEPSGWGCTEVMPQTACTGATMEVLGQTGCQSVGDCSAPFPPPEATVFVGTDGGFATLAEALAAAPDGGVIAVEQGTYVETLTVARSVTLVGRCAEKVVLQAPQPVNAAGIEVTGGSLTLSGLTVSGHFNGAVVHAGATLTASHVVFSENAVSGINAPGGTVVLADSVIRDGVRDSTGDWGEGLYADTGANISLHRVAVSNNAKAGLDVEHRSSQLLLDGVIVRDTRPAGDGTNGEGAFIVDGATAQIHGSAFVHNAEAGLGIEGPQFAVTVTLDGSVIRDTVPRAHGLVDPNNANHKQFYGNNIEAQGRVSVTMTNTSLLRSGGESMIVATTPATASLTDSTLYSAQVAPDGESLAGLIVQAGAHVSLLRTAVAEMSGAGIQEQGKNCQLSMVGSLVANTSALGTNPAGHGVEVDYDAGAVLSGCAITGTTGMGLYLGAGASVSMDSSVIGWASRYPNGWYGRGLDLGGGSTFTMTSSALVANHEVAMLVTDPGTLAQVSASVVRDTTGSTDGLFGRGINVQTGGRLELSDSLLSNNRDIGLSAGEANSVAVVERSVITGTQVRASDQTFGIGVASFEDARVDLKQTQVLESGSTALVVGEAAATVDACLIARNPVALQAEYGSMLQQVMQIPETVGPRDVLVTDDTLFDANVSRLGTGTVPVPESR